MISETQQNYHFLVDKKQRFTSAGMLVAVFSARFKLKVEVRVKVYVEIQAGTDAP